ncbi:ribosomal protein L7Ae/L30e/S12e/Gadd45 [Tanacetum coccineum]
MDFKEKRHVSLDKSKIECYNCHRKWHFARECRSGRNQGKRSYGDNGRSNAPTNESSSQALVAQDGLGGYDWSNDFEIEPNESDHVTFSPKSDPLHHEFTGELITIPPRIVREHENYINRMSLLCRNSSSRSPKNFHTIIESLPTSTTLVEDSDSNREEIDIFSGPDDSIPPGIESDFDSEEDIIENLLNDDPIHERLTYDREPDVPVINNVDELNEDECFDPGRSEINVEVDDSFTFVTRTFLPYLTYPEVRILQKSQENGQNRTNTDMGKEREYKSRENAIKGTIFHRLRRLLELERVMVDRTIKSQTVTLTPNQILTKVLSPDMKQWEELIRYNVFGLGGHRDHLPACLAHMLYCVVTEEQYNLAYFFVKRIKCARANPTANLPYGMFLTRLYRHIMEAYPHLDNGIYDIVDRVMRPLALKQT